MESVIKKLEQRVSDLESKTSAVVPKKERKPRKPSEYNDFMKDYFSKNKDPKKTHKELFGEAAKAWSSKKNTKV
jgi:hypothetical protein